MEWSTERPKESGWYWCWKARGVRTKPQLVEFHRHERGDGTYLIEPTVDVFSHYCLAEPPLLPEPEWPTEPTFSGVLQKWRKELRLLENTVTIRRYIEDFIKDLEKLQMQEYYAYWGRRLRVKEYCTSWQKET